MKYICYFFFFFIICYLFHQLLFILLSAICCHQSTVGWWVSANMENTVTAAKKPTHCHWPLIKALTLFVFVFLEPLVKALTLCNLTLLRFRFTSHSLHCASSSQQWTELFTLLCLSVCTVLLSKYVSVKKYVGQTTKVKILLNCLNFPFLEIWRSLKYLFATKR